MIQNFCSPSSSSSSWPLFQLLGCSSGLHVQQSPAGCISLLLLVLLLLVLLAPPHRGVPPGSVLGPQQSASRWCDCLFLRPRVVLSISAHRVWVLRPADLRFPRQQTDHSGLVGFRVWECELPPGGGRGGSGSALWRETAPTAAEEWVKQQLQLLMRVKGKTFLVLFWIPVRK